MTQTKNTNVASFLKFSQASSFGYPLLLSSTLMLFLSGCQTTPSVKNNIHARTVTKTVSSSQLSNRAALPSTSQLAKNNLFEAIQKSLDTDHESVQNITYNVRPYLNKSSIDYGDRSLYQTVMAVYLYSSEQKNLEESAEAEEYTEEPTLSKEAALKQTFNYASSYMKMKEQEKAQGYKFSASNKTADSKTGFFQSMMEQLDKNPQQLEALQAYYADNYTISSVNNYKVSSRTYQGVISLDYSNKVQEVSAQIPYSLNFDQGSITLDPSAAQPFMAVLMPEKMGIFDGSNSHTVEMALPDEFLQQLPTDVVFDALIAGIKAAFANIDSEHYTAVDIRHDLYAQQLGATQAVKINFNSTQSGDFIGGVIKTMGKEFEAEIDTHPERYEDAEQFKKLVAVWSSISTDTHTADIGNLLQIVESILPMRLNNNVYYYLSADNSLLGAQSKGSFGSEFYGMTTDTVNQITYNKHSVQQHPLYALSVENFSESAPKPINANKWLDSNAQQKDYSEQAEYARDYYEDGSAEYVEEADQYNDIDESLDFSNTLNIDANAATAAIQDDARDSVDGESSELTDFDKTKRAFEAFEE